MPGEINRIKNREMADQSIALSFKGILRVANIQEATDKNEDVYFNPIYYGTPNKGISSESTGYDSAYYGLSGSLNRYSFEGDNYKNAKVPVTDTLGNYMNINVGADSITIGSDELNNGNNADTVNFTQLLYGKEFTQEKVFPVLKSDKLIIGLQERRLPEEKSTVNDAELTIDASPYADNLEARIIVNNSFNHSPENIEENGETYKKIEGEKSYRTIYQDTNSSIRDYDALVHYQDNIDWHNLDKNKVVDSIVDIVNLKDYVKEKLNQFIETNVVEVPTGMVIWQYVSLKKWYAIDFSYSGNNPPMGKVQDTDNYTPTLYQGVVRKGINRLVALSHEEDDTNTYGNKQLKEIIPLYKRDYVLADGGTYTIYMLLPEMSNNYDYPSYERFIDLFFAIGYQYTTLDVIRDHYKNEVVRTEDGENIYGWAGNRRVVSKACENKEVLFGLDLLQMLAIKAIYNELKTGTSNNGRSGCLENDSTYYSRENAENWLKTQPLPREFIFNSPVPSSEGGMTYPYKPAAYDQDDDKTYNIEIGLEVNSFNSYVWYYDHTEEKYLKCRAWQTAEVQGVLDLFEKVNISRERELKNYFTFPFQVVNMIQDLTDKYTTGTYIGFTPFIWADENKDFTGLEQVSSFSASSHPHRHAIFRGPNGYSPYPSVRWDTGVLSDNVSMARSEGVDYWIDYLPYKSLYFNLNSYVMAELPNTKYVNEIHNGVNTKIIQWGDNTGPDNPDPRWKNGEPNRGITSPPIDVGIIDEKHTSASKNQMNGEVLWFAPENLQMLPLIKL